MSLRSLSVLIILVAYTNMAQSAILSNFVGEYRIKKASSAQYCGETLKIKVHEGVSLLMDSNANSSIEEFRSVPSRESQRALRVVDHNKSVVVDAISRSMGKNAIKETFEDGYAYRSYSGSREIRLSNRGQSLSYSLSTTYSTRDEFGSSTSWTVRPLLKEKCEFIRVK